MTGATVKSLICLVSLLMVFSVKAQENKISKSYLLTGVVIDVEDREEMPYVNVRLKNTFYGTATDINGYFSLYVNTGDTLVFSYVGYEDASFIMPFELAEQQYTLLQLMRKDTIVLEEVVVFPWPSYENFVNAFLDAEPESSDSELITDVTPELQETMDEAEMNRYYHDQRRYQRLFQMHQIFPPNNFLDPGRWADFIRDLRTSDDDQ